MGVVMMMEVSSKTILVTGASRGIGAAIAQTLSAEGARIALCYHQHKDDADAVSDLCVGETMCLPLNVSARTSVRDALDAVIDRWGHLDVLVNNAGFLKQTPFAVIRDEEWQYTLDTNLKGVFLCSQLAADQFKVQADSGHRGGAIVNITSVGGQMGGTKAPHYAAAKAGVISITKSTAKLLAPIGVRVNAVAPGFIKTDMFEHIVTNTDINEILSSIPLARVGLPQDVADAVSFLISEKASYITGHVLNVNGGLYLGAGS